MRESGGANVKNGRKSHKKNKRKIIGRLRVRRVSNRHTAYMQIDVAVFSRKIVWWLKQPADYNNKNYQWKQIHSQTNQTNELKCFFFSSFDCDSTKC